MSRILKKIIRFAVWITVMFAVIYELSKPEVIGMIKQALYFFFVIFLGCWAFSEDEDW